MKAKHMHWDDLSLPQRLYLRFWFWRHREELRNAPWIDGP